MLHFKSNRFDQCWAWIGSSWPEVTSHLAVRLSWSWMSAPIKRSRLHVTQRLFTFQFLHEERELCVSGAPVDEEWCTFLCFPSDSEPLTEVALTVNAEGKGFIIEGQSPGEAGWPVLWHHHAGRPSECCYVVWFERRLQGRSAPLSTRFRHFFLMSSSHHMFVEWSLTFCFAGF